MMNHLKFVLFVLVLAVTAAAFAQTAGTTKPVKKPAPTPGERAFQNNCSRCHYAPEELSPRITGTVVRHMRVRANLSAEEERLIMSYLAP